MVASTKTLKEINTISVLNIIQENGSVSRADIVKRSKLAFPTVMRIIDSLINLGLVLETGKGDVDIGRKPMLLKLNKDAFYVIGIVILSRLDVVVADLASNVLSSRHGEINITQFNFEKQIEKIVELVEETLNESGIAKQAIAGVGVGMPGTNFKFDDATENSQFAGWQRNVDVKKLLEERLMMPVQVDNISRTMTYGEIFYGLGRRLKDFIFVWVDFGLSGNLVRNSDIYAGKHNVAGEYGHVSVDPLSGRNCYCGNLGCIEMYASEVGIARSVRNMVEDNPDSNLFRMIGGEKQKIDFLAFPLIVKAFRSGDTFIKTAFDEGARMLGYFLANIVNIIDPPAIVLGGSVITAYPDMAGIAEAVMRENVFSNRARKIEVLTSLLPEEKRYLGTTSKVIMNAMNRYAVGN